MIRHLAQDHEVHVVSLARSAEEAKAGEGLAGYCKHSAVALVSNPVQVLRMIARLPTPVPSTLGYFRSSRATRLVTEKLGRVDFDLIVVHSSSMAQYVEHVGGICKVLDFCDMDSQKWLEYGVRKPLPLSLGYWLEGSKLEREEKRMSRHFDLCTVATPAELATLDGYRTGAATDWFPNGVDVEYFTPQGEDYERETITFIGRMDYYPNEECMVRFCAQTLPLLRAHRPGVRLQIVGAEPSRKVRRLGEAQGVVVTGSVPDVRPYLYRSALAIAPLDVARGTQNKILEAMAAGVPVVASRKAAGGVDAVAGEHLLVAEMPGEYASAIERVLAEPAERQRLSVAGRERVLHSHRWEGSMQRLDRIIERCMTGGQGRAASGTAPPEPGRLATARDQSGARDSGRLESTPSS